jgi:parallel beta-helix repeat protein
VNNQVDFPAGGLGTPIRVEAASTVTVDGNTLSRPTTEGRCILVYANGDNVTNPVITNNQCVGGNYSQIDFQAETAWTVNQVECTGNSCLGGGDGESANSISMRSAVGAVISDNTCESNAAPSLYLYDVQEARVSGNSFQSSGGVSVLAGGLCTGSDYAKDNVQNGEIVNTSIGLVIL